MVVAVAGTLVVADVFGNIILIALFAKSVALLVMLRKYDITAMIRILFLDLLWFLRNPLIILMVPLPIFPQRLWQQPHQFLLRMSGGFLTRVPPPCHQ